MNPIQAAIYERKLTAAYKRIDARLKRHEDKLANVFEGMFRAQLPPVLKKIRKKISKLSASKEDPQLLEWLQAEEISLDAADNNPYKVIEVNIRSALHATSAKYIPRIKSGMVQAGTAAAQESAIGLNFKFPGFPKATTKFLDSYTPKLANILDETTLTRIVNQIKEGVKAGESTQEIAMRLRNTFSGFTRRRARLIAENEVNLISGMTENDMWEASPVKNKLRSTWRNSRDELVRDLHEIEGETIKFGQKFSNGLRFPHDPEGAAENVINCRCWLERRLA